MGAEKIQLKKSRNQSETQKYQKVLGNSVQNPEHRRLASGSRSRKPVLGPSSLHAFAERRAVPEAVTGVRQRPTQRGLGEDSKQCRFCQRHTQQGIGEDFKNEGLVSAPPIGGLATISKHAGLVSAPPSGCLARISKNEG